MEKLIRFGVSVPKNLLKKFDKLIKARNYGNRSEAIRDLIRESFVEEEWTHAIDIAGGISMVYDHHHRQLVNKLIEAQHKFHNLIISSQHIHLDHNNCLEFIVVKGKAEEVKKLYNILKSTKGVKHVGLMKSTVGKEIV
ncbi:MAG: nickel-responsive transcriptional regulator NikR [Ignavibacteria bacterium]|nr:nickel-responsive transcriptional regulator NikR [Ignavibacteria bacterium]